MPQRRSTKGKGHGAAENGRSVGRLLELHWPVRIVDADRFPGFDQISGWRARNLFVGAMEDWALDFLYVNDARMDEVPKGRSRSQLCAHPIALGYFDSFTGVVYFKQHPKAKYCSCHCGGCPNGPLYDDSGVTSSDLRHGKRAPGRIVKLMEAATSHTRGVFAVQEGAVVKLDELNPYELWTAYVDRAVGHAIIGELRLEEEQEQEAAQRRRMTKGDRRKVELHQAGHEQRLADELMDVLMDLFLGLSDEEMSSRMHNLLDAAQLFVHTTTPSSVYRYSLGVGVKKPNKVSRKYKPFYESLTPRVTELYLRPRLHVDNANSKVQRN